MRKSLKLALRQSEIRQRLNELLALDTRTDDQDTELETLTTEAQRLEPELRAALVAEAEADQAADNAFRNGNAPENVELRGLVRDSSLAEIVAAAVERRLDRRPDGGASIALRPDGIASPARHAAGEPRRDHCPE